MDERDTMTPGTAADAGDSPGAPGPGHRWTGWYRGLGRRGRLILTSGAVVVAVAVALAVIGSTAGGAGGHARTLPAAKNFTASVLGHPGQQLSLRQYAGKPVIVNFFASWCPPCQKETPLIAKFYRTSHGKVTIIGIDVNDQAAAARKFVHAQDVTYPVGTDPAASTATSYGVRGLPQTFFLNARHRIAKRIIGAVTMNQLRAGTALISKPTK